MNTSVTIEAAGMRRRRRHSDEFEAEVIRALLIAQVLVAKYADHQPLYRQEGIIARAGLAIPRSTQAQWVGTAGVQLALVVDAMKRDLMSRSVLHADETPVAMLAPGRGKTHRAYP